MSLKRLLPPIGLVFALVLVQVFFPGVDNALGATTVAVDSVSPSAGNNIKNANLTYSFTNTAGTLLVVCAIAGDPAQSISGVAYGGVAMSPVANARSHDGATGALASMWYLLNPATGANSVVVTKSGTAAPGYIISGAISFIGNDATNPIAQSVTNHAANGTTASVAVPGTVAGNMLVDCTSNGSAMGTSLQTLNFRTNINGSDYGNNAASSYAAAGGNVTMGYSGNQNDGWAIVAAEIKASAVSDAQAPTVPTNLSATAISQSQINLSWAASSDNVGVTGYAIYRNGSQVGTSATNNYSDAGLAASTQYTYTIDAYDAAGNHSAQSTSASATTQAPANQAPVIFSFTANPTSVTLGNSTALSWSVSGTPIPTLSINNGVGTVSGSNISVSPATTTTYTLTATNSQGSANANATVTVIPPDTTPPTAPAGLSAAAISSSQINLSWTASTDNVAVTGYKVFRNGSQVGTSASASYSDTGLAASTLYTYTVSAYDAAGNNSAQSTSASATTQAQIAPGAIIAPVRRVDWTGDGAGAIPNRTTICATFNPGATAAQINTALAACNNGVVFLNAGTYNLGSPGINIAKGNVTLRGAGPDQTKIVFAAAGHAGCNGLGASFCIIGDGNWWSGAPGNTANWTAGYAKDTNQITLSSVTGLSAGKLLILDQADDTTDDGSIYNCQTINKCTQQGTDVGRAGRGQHQTVTVTAVNGNVVTITPALANPNWRSSQNPGAWWSTTAPISGVGVEDLSLDYTAVGTAASYGMQIHDATNCWVKDIRSLFANNGHIEFYQSNHITVRDSYFYGNQHAASQSYGMEPWLGDNLLFENNIYEHEATPLVMSGSVGSVMAYNYMLNDYYNNGDAAWFQASMYDHEQGSNYNLWEGNNGPGMTADNIHGPSDFNTLFRNRIDGKDPLNDNNKTEQTVPVDLYAINRFFNVIGNVLGTAGYHISYEVNVVGGNTANCDVTIYRLGWNGNCNNSDGVADPTLKTTLMRWGNYDTVNNAALWNAAEVPSALTGAAAPYSNPVPTDQNLPASFYLSGQPSWWTTPWGTPPWPATGPDVSGGNITNVAGHANKTPAQLCYEHMAYDTGYTANTVRVFNANNCYTSSGGGGDTTPPTASLTAPASGATVSSTISVAATAADNVAVTRVEFYLDNVLQATDAATPYTWSWNTTGSANGSHSLTAKAYDAAGNIGTSPTVTVTVSNNAPDTTAPTASITSPAAGTVSGSITFSATASDPVVGGQVTSGLKSITLFIDGSTFATSTASPISRSLDTTTLSNAAHTLTAQAQDNAGNNSTIASVSITVNNVVAQKFPRLVTLASLEGIAAIPANQPITATVLSGGTTLETQANLLPNASKQYTVTFLAADPQLVDLRIKATGYLSQLLLNVDTTANSAVALSIPQLLAGDSNNDNAINALDYSLMNTHWLQNFAQADINGDKLVNSLDFAILKNNFGKGGL